MDIKGKNVIVIGLGISGIAAAEALLVKGALVSVYDKKEQKDMETSLLDFLVRAKAPLYLGTEPKDMEGFDFAVLSPGVPLTSSLVIRAKEKNVPIIGEVELAWQLGKANYVAITGTNGKTTTTVLTGEIFKEAMLPTEVVGNVGLPVTKRALSVKPDTWMITEISSFQLETIDKFHPHIAALLNITPDHMDRHLSMQGYAEAKARIFMNQSAEDYCIINHDDAESWNLAASCPGIVVPFSRKKELEFGCYIKERTICIKDNTGIVHTICGADELGIPGAHNLENALAAAGIAFFAGISPSIIGKTLRQFNGVAHRLEFVAEIQGVRFLNDSKGTNPDASIKAIEAVDGGIVLIAGGYDKGSTFEAFVKAFGSKVHTLVLMGKTASKIAEAATAEGFENIHLEEDMKSCVEYAFKSAAPGDTVLLSPACASWDMYSCFEERGEHFKECVEKLAK